MSFLELFKKKQLPLLPKNTELQEADFKKIMKNLGKEPFGSECVIWKGVYCNKGKEKKGVYINYYFNKKKESLHRLLYRNYVNSTLNERVYLIHQCNNKLCCNVDHLKEKRHKDEIKKEDMYKIDFEVSF